MALKAGLLGFALLDALEVAKPYFVGAGNKAAVTVTLCNGSAAPITVRAAYLTDAGDSLAKGLAAGRSLVGGSLGLRLPPGETVQATTMLGPGQGLAVASDTAGEVSVTVNGIEEAL